jgi:hypothetical protein
VSRLKVTETETASAVCEQMRFTWSATYKPLCVVKGEVIHVLGQAARGGVGGAMSRIPTPLH